MGLFSFLKKSSTSTSKYAYESGWRVLIAENVLTSIDYKENSQFIPISDIKEIIVETNDSGPWGTDLWWIILGSEIEIHVPNGATGEQEMMQLFQSLVGFDNEELIKSMASVTNERFVCYRRLSSGTY